MYTQQARTVCQAADGQHLDALQIDDTSTEPSTCSDFIDFVDEIIKDNQDIWDKMINNTFCAKMADGSADIASFKWYMVQDILYLKNYVRWKMGLFAKAPREDARDAAAAIQRDLGYVDSQRKTCVEDLGIPEDVVNSAVAFPGLQAYCDHLLQCTQNEDWFTLHVIIVPCLIGYDTIASQYYNDLNTVKDTVFYKHWIAANIGGSSPARYRKFLNQHVADYDSVTAKANWKALFRKSCQMEIDMWEACMTHKI